NNRQFLRSIPKDRDEAAPGEPENGERATVPFPIHHRRPHDRPLHWHGPYEDFRRELGASVIRDGSGGPRLVDRVAGGRRTGDREGGDVDEAPHADVPRGFQHIGRTVAIGRHELGGRASYDLAGDMKYHVGTGAPVPQRGLIVEIAAHEPNLWSP